MQCLSPPWVRRMANIRFLLTNGNGNGVLPLRTNCRYNRARVFISRSHSGRITASLPDGKEVHRIPGDRCVELRRSKTVLILTEYTRKV